VHGIGEGESRSRGAPAELIRPKVDQAQARSYKKARLDPPVGDLGPTTCSNIQGLRPMRFLTPPFFYCFRTSMLWLTFQTTSEQRFFYWHHVTYGSQNFNVVLS
jgi:hypothetical protein